MRRISPEWFVAAGLLILLLLTSSRYGWHRDELYFVVAGQHPAWGYPDQPSFTPLLSAALTTGRDGWMIAAGAVLGVGLLNKLVIGVVVALICAALLILGPRRPLLSRPALAGGVLALLGAAPYVLWQSAHGWPQSEVAGSISGPGNRIGVIPIQLFLVSIFLAPFLIAGLLRLCRPFAWAYPALLVLVIVTGGKGYYAAGMVPLLAASGGIAADTWLARGRQELRMTTVSVAIGVSLVLNALNTLPIEPASRLQASGTNELNAEAGEQVGWPEYRAAVREAVRNLPADQRDRAVVFTSTYSEASAVRLGDGLPPAYSGQNGYALWPPPESAAGPVILTGFAAADTTVRRFFTGCRVVGRVDNGYGLANYEQGALVQTCDGPAGGWAAAWPSLVHYD